jgi:hypothetical protein
MFGVVVGTMVTAARVFLYSSIGEVGSFPDVVNQVLFID